jgi:hypothetical protein
MNNAQQIGLGIVCLLSVGFMLWFLVALVIDAKKASRRAARVLFIRESVRNDAGGNRVADLFEPGSRRLEEVSTGQSASAHRRAHSKTIAAPQQVQVFRLTDKHSEDRLKLRWLIMLLVLSAHFCLPARTSNSSTSSLSTLSIAVSGFHLIQSDVGGKSCKTFFG